MPIDLTMLAAVSQSPREIFWCMTPDAVQRAFALRISAQTLASEPVKVRDAGRVRVISVDRMMHYDPEAWFAISIPDLVKQFNAARADENVGAVVLELDCPGSTAFGMLDLGDSANKLAESKPLFGHNVGLCASGAYWLGSTCTKLFASRRTDVGSIGTRMAIYDWSKAFAEAGIIPKVIDTGEFKSMGLLGTEITDKHVAHLQSQIDELQSDFLAQVSKGRNLTGDALAAVADGRVWLAEHAAPLGLIDGVQSLEETIQLAADAAPQKAVNPRSSKMSEPTKIEPQAATLAELKVCCPGASSEFVLAQLERSATKEQAMQAHMTALQEANEASLKAKNEAEQRANEAEEKAAKSQGGSTGTPAPKTRGNKAPASTATQSDGAETDYREMASEYMDKHKCRWSEACLAIKQRHPEARAFFGAPPVRS